MNRLLSLIDELEREYPKDSWIRDFRALKEDDTEANFYSKFSIYESALNSLSDDAWQSLKTKIKKLFKQNTNGRGKAPFFNQLNEALAYEYLQSRGCVNISFPPEGEEKMPDLKFEENDEHGHCEVKTIGVSDNEYSRINGDAYDNSVE